MSQRENEELTQRFRAQFSPKVVKPVENEQDPTDRSSPLTLEQTYQIRFDRADIKTIENTLGIGYPAFIRSGILGSLTATEVYIWRGLRQEDGSGILVHVFPATDAGREQAGNLVWSFLGSGGDAGILTDEIVEGFVTAGLFTRKKTDVPADAPVSEDSPKN